MNVSRPRVSRPEEEMVFRGTGAMKWLNIGVMLFCLLGINSVAVAQEGSIEEAKALSEQAEDLYQQGRYEEAIPRDERVLAICEKVLGLEHPGTAAALTNLAKLYRVTGAYSQAEPLLHRALAINEKVLGPEHSDTAVVLLNLAELYHEIRSYARAEPLYQRALVIWEKTLGPEHPNTATALNNLAGLYRRIGAYAKAEPLYQRALAIQEKTLGPEHPDTAVSLNNLARFYQATGAYAKAEPLLQRALTIREKALGPKHPDTAQVLESLGWLRVRMNEPLTALPFLEQSHTIMWKTAGRFLLTGSESRKQAYFQTLRETTSALISFSLVLSGRRATTLGFTSVLQSKGRVLDAMSDSLEHLRQSVKPSDRLLLDKLIAVTRQQSAFMHKSTENLQSEASRQRLQELTNTQEQLEAELSSRSAEFRKQVVPVTLSDVQAAIPRGAVLVEWYRYHPFDPNAMNMQSLWGKPRYVAYVLRHEGEPEVVDLGEAELIEKLVHDFRVGLSNPTSTYTKDVAQDLSEKLVKPILPFLRDTDRLFVSPDSALNLIPFGALIDKQGQYLASKMDITYLTSGRDLLRLEATSAGNGEAVIVADPDYGWATVIVATSEVSERSTRSVDLDRGGLVFRSLPGTAAEAKTLRTLLKVGDGHVLTQAKATEDRFKLLRGPRILHVATHGFFLKDNELPTAQLRQVSFAQDKPLAPVGDNPLLRSGLALAGANLRRSGDKDDGILTAAEVAQMDLRGTQLVVLSACETGVGDVQNGEGVYGLRRALILAGAESQVTSLWKVADEATKDLMVDYYKRLLKGEGRSEALRNAQLKMMKSKDRSHPYYWAAFVPIGDWRPLAKGR